MTESEKNEKKQNQEERLGKTEERWSLFSMFVIALMCIFVITLFALNENSALMQIHYELKSAADESNDSSAE